MQTAWRSSLLLRTTPRGRLTSKQGSLPLRRPLLAPRRGLNQRAVVVRSAVDPVDRALGSAPYLLPLLDGLKYGTYVFNAYPAFARILSPIFPLYELYTSIPLGSLIVFFALYFGIARNLRFNRFVRFNAMQAILIDILLILPGFLIQMLRLSSEIRIPLSNITWMYVFCCTAIGIGSCWAGQAARLPLVANASDAQIEGPQTPLHKALQDYAHGVELQEIMQEMMTELLMSQPEEPIPFMIAFLEAKRNGTVQKTCLQESK